jgi:sphinganine-1-phosphate aldolase
MIIPMKGKSESKVLEELESFKSKDFDWRSGRIMGYVYDPGRQVEEVGKKAYMAFLTENALDPTLYKSLLKIENDLIAMTAHHLNGDGNVVGTFTSGGTESILLAVKTARDYARAVHPEIEKPEMLMPMTAHAAFHKAAEYFDVTPVMVPVGPGFKADVEKMRKAITRNTILMVGSAPSYAHGVVDPIPELAAIAAERGLLFHTDACVGGFMLPYYRRLGQVFPDFDFTVPGVTSISMDLHKYGYTPKNASMVLYRSKEIRKHQFFSCSRWPGYSVINSAVQSSKTGGSMAAAWAVMNFLGDDGYMNIARHTRDATIKLSEAIARIDGLRLMAKPDLCMFSFTSDSIDVFHIIDEMLERGWYVQPQLTCGSSVKNIHISMNESSSSLVDVLLKDLEESVRKARGMRVSGTVEEIIKLLSGRAGGPVSEAEMGAMMEALGVVGSNMPQRMVDINEILDVMPPELRERLFVGFFNEIYIQSVG